MPSLLAQPGRLLLTDITLARCMVIWYFRDRLDALLQILVIQPKRCPLWIALQNLFQDPFAEFHPWFVDMVLCVRVTPDSTI